MDVRNPERVAALSAWQKAAGRLVMKGQRSFNEDYPAPPHGLTPDDLRTLGYAFHNERSAYNFLDGAAKSMARIDFSPTLRHQSMLVQGPQDWAGALLWVDGESVPVPRDADGNPLVEKHARWPDDRFMYAPVGGLSDHPRFDPRTFDRLGDVRGLLIWDALRHERRLELPEPHQYWPSPQIELRAGALHIYADRDAAERNQADRVVPVPPPPG